MQYDKYSIRLTLKIPKTVLHKTCGLYMCLVKLYDVTGIKTNFGRMRYKGFNYGPKGRFLKTKVYQVYMAKYKYLLTLKCEYRGIPYAII